MYSYLPGSKTIQKKIIKTAGPYTSRFSLFTSKLRKLKTSKLKKKIEKNLLRHAIVF